MYCISYDLQIKDPAKDTLRDLAQEAVSGVVDGKEPKPENFMELVFGTEMVELDGFMGQVKVSMESGR